MYVAYIRKGKQPTRKQQVRALADRFIRNWEKKMSAKLGRNKNLTP